MKLFRLLAVLYVSTLAFFAKAQTNDWATYYKALADITWNKKDKFNYDQVFAQLDKAQKAVSEPQIQDARYGMLRAEEANNATRLAQYTKMLNDIKAKATMDYPNELKQIIKEKNYSKFIEFVRTKGYPSPNKLAALSDSKASDLYEAAGTMLSHNERDASNPTKMPQELLDKALRDGCLRPYKYAQIMDWKGIMKNEGPFYFIFYAPPSNISKEEVIKRREAIWLYEGYGGYVTGKDVWTRK